MNLVIASTNVHKIREFRDLFKDLPGYEIFSLHDFPDYKPGPEEGSDFEEIAIQKAVDAAKSLKQLVLAEDSGLVVPSLNNEPGIFSRRYAGEDATDRENRAKLLENLGDKADLDRSAYFVCSIAIANEEGLLKNVTARCEGEITTEEKGRGGFGYDTLFRKHDYEKTFAELDEDVKNRISHRCKAFEKLAFFLESLNRQMIEG